MKVLAATSSDTQNAGQFKRLEPRMELPSSDTQNAWQYTGEIGFLSESVDSGGNAMRSTQQNGTSFFSDFLLRGEKEESYGAKFSFQLNSHTPLYQRRREEKQLRFTYMYENKNTKLTLCDMVPRLSPWTLQGQRLFGIWYNRQMGPRRFQFIAAKNRPGLSSTQRDRYTIGGNLAWIASGPLSMSAEVIMTFDRDAGASGNRQEYNQVWQSKIGYDFETGRKVELEFAHSIYQNKATPAVARKKGNAFRLSGTFPYKKYKIKATLEDVDDGFKTLSGYSSSGRRVFLSEIITPVGQRITFTTGYTKNETERQNLTSVPFIFTLQPFRRDNVHVIADHTRQHLSGTGESTFNRSSGLQITNKWNRNTLSLGTRSDSYRSGSELSNILFLDFNTALSENTGLKFRASRDKRRAEPLPRNMFRLGIDWDIGEWSGFQLSQEIQDRTGLGRHKNITKAAFHLFDPVRNCDFSLDYQYNSRGDYHDNVLASKFTYTF